MILTWKTYNPATFGCQKELAIKPFIDEPSYFNNVFFRHSR